MVGDRGRMLRRRHLTLTSYDDRQAIDDGHHDAFVGTTTSFSRIPSPPLFIRNGFREDRSSVEPSRIALALRRSSRWCVTLGSFQESHHVRFKSIGLADRRRFGFVLVRLRVRVVALHRHRVTHPWWYYVGQALDCVSSIDFVASYARHLVHSESSCGVPSSVPRKYQ